MADQPYTIVVDAHFERLLTSHPEMKRQLSKLVKQVLVKARSEVQGAARGVMEKDPRAAYKAVRRMVYKSILGGNISILTPRKASSKSYVPDSPQERVGRGGNRIPRSKRTEQMMSYYGEDRGFVLRWLNAGTAARTSRYGNRGSITASNWFEPSSQAAIEKAMNQVQSIIDKTIEETEV